MENAAIARLLADIADLLEIKGENAFKVRAYRNASWTVADCPERLADQPPERLRELGGIGRDLAARIREAVDTGGIAYHRELVAEFPPGILDVLRLQGVGPKTVALLHAQLGIGSLDDLEAAARAGRLRAIKGMGAKKEALVLKAIEERRRFAGRHLLPEAAATADALIEWLAPQFPVATFDLVGSLRRGAETVGDLDVLACGAGPEVMDAFTRHPLAERVLARGETKSSVLLVKGYQADLRLVPPASRGAAQQYFTGSKAHNIALRDRALQRGWKLNEYGLYRSEDDAVLAGETEEGIYAALGLDWVPPELREHRGEVEAAAAHRLPRLVALGDIRGDLHTHTDATDGRDTIVEMARAARDRGYEYLAITDHSQALAMANGLDERGTLQHAHRIRAAMDEVEGITLLAGIECDIRPDGTLDLADDCLAQLDLVVVSVHSAFTQSPAEMTARVLRALENRWVDVLGHPTGRLLLRREPYGLDLEQVIAAAARLGVALEINCQADRLDLNDAAARLAHERGAGIVISTDAHARTALDTMRWGVTVARRAWLPPAAVWNTRGLEALRAGLRRNRAARS